MIVMKQNCCASFDTVSRAVVIGHAVVGPDARDLAGIGYYFAARENDLIDVGHYGLGVGTFIGSTVVWIPVCLWLILVENEFSLETALASTVPTSFRPLITSSSPTSCMVNRAFIRCWPYSVFFGRRPNAGRWD